MDKLLTLSRRARALPSSIRYLCATLLVLAALLVRMALDEVLHGLPFIFFFPAVVLIALAFDWGTGLYATLLSGALALYFFLPRTDGLVVLDKATLIPFGVFLVTCGGLAVLTEAFHKVYAAALARAERAERVREMLMREMSHRIKNKLQFLVSTINLHARTGADVHEVVRAAVSRIGVIGRVHNTLFDQAGENSIEVQKFISGLSADLQTSLFGERPIRISTDVDPIELDLDAATSIGILVNELVTNAAKHAFAAGERGNVFVRLHRVDSSHCELVVKDDGRGMSENAPQGFGTRIVGIMVTQLKGRMQMANTPGATFKVTFPLRERSPGLV